MTRPLILLVAVAAVFAARAAAEQPPVPAVTLGVTHAQPVAGHTFTGVTVANAGMKIRSIDCTGTIGRKILRPRLLRFYAPLVVGPAAVSCSWAIPADAAGKRLETSVIVTLSGEQAGPSAPISWRVR